MNCPTCDKKMVRRGFRKTGLGKKQLYLCNSCKRKSTVDWPRMRFPKNEVMHAVKLYKSGMSAAKVKTQLESRDITVSRWTIIKWSRKFS